VEKLQREPIGLGREENLKAVDLETGKKEDGRGERKVVGKLLYSRVATDHPSKTELGG